MPSHPLPTVPLKNSCYKPGFFFYIYAKKYQHIRDKLNANLKAIHSLRHTYVCVCVLMYVVSYVLIFLSLQSL